MRTVTANTTLLESDDVINCDCTDGNITVSLPYGNSISYLQQFTIVKVDKTSNVVNIVPQAGEAIDGAAKITLKTDPLYNSVFRLQALSFGWHNPASKAPIVTSNNANFNPNAASQIQKIAGDPDTSTWGAAEEGIVWEDTTTGKTKKWDGKKIVLLG